MFVGREKAMHASVGPRLRRVVAFVLLLLVGALGAATAQQQRAAILLTLDGPVGPATADYIVRGLDAAAERGAPLVVLQMDTPGGLDTSMRDIIRAILASPVPVATYVAPSGARAASAGTYIAYASHVAAMAPGTNIGAATPVQIGGGGGLPFGGNEGGEASKEDGEGTDGADKPAAPADAHEAKAVNDAVAYIHGLAELRGRNADWAERAVRDAASLPAGRAVAENVVDFTADNIDALLGKADGMTVGLGHTKTTLATAGLTVESIDPDWRTKLLAVITNPNVALILMMIGIYGILFEFLTPGTFVPGTIGGISLLLGLYALAVLPVSYAGAGLVVLGLALLAAEAFVPSFGVLGLGGAVAFVLGGVILFDTDVPGLSVSWALLGGVAAAGLALSLLVASMVVATRRRAVVTGREEMIGMAGEVLEWSGTSGHVFVHGERWHAVGDKAFARGAGVRVAAIDGLTLHVTADTTPERR